ncbi:MAG: TlyA family RNA methyltransferase [Planctomycetota bacterium]|jgi:23S rRNA (cytidine1920-2'-O)/16S rRNA (cytidine1409-2'-O)-methyltransferase
MSDSSFVSRAGHKLAAAIDALAVDVSGLTCADFGCHTGGFTDCLLQNGAARVYAVDTSYGILAWKLRTHPNVIVVERTNAMHVTLPEAVDLVTVDTGWTPQQKILPSARNQLKPDGRVITLIKPQYEAPKTSLEGGVVPEDLVQGVIDDVLARIADMGWTVEGTVQSPIKGHGGNVEWLALLSVVCGRD